MNRKTVLSVPYISQKGLLATGCELVSGMMVLQYYDCNVTVEQMIQSVPRSSLTKSGGMLYGESPSDSFIGDPHSEDGFGCYAPVLASGMNTFLGKEGKYRAIDCTGGSLPDLAEQYIPHGTPIIIWATMNMNDPAPGKVWKLNSTGKPFQWIAGEHCLVLVGYDWDNYYFNDPYESNGLVSYPKSVVESRFESLGRQAVVVVSADEE